MAKKTDVRVKDVALYFLPVTLRLPFKFGPETVTHDTCARVSMRVETAGGKSGEGWGESPLAPSWVWPGAISYEARTEVLREFSARLAKAWSKFEVAGHPMEIGHAFQKNELRRLFRDFNKKRRASQAMPWLAALVCCSAFDLALHDAYGRANDVPTYETYNRRFMNRDLAAYLTPAEGCETISFARKWPQDFFASPVPTKLPAWHLIGGKDLIDKSELTGAEPNDGYPVVLTEWIKRDGIKCLKVKLRGNDGAWDYERMVRVGQVAIAQDVPWLTADFNCTVSEPAYVNAILDRLVLEQPRTYGMILYVEQPFPYDLEKHRIDVHSVSARKPLFMDESAHDWRLVRLGRSLGWSGVALKTCKTQTGALLTLCWAKAHGMTLMVQDLTNPMLAQVTHLLLAAHAGTIMGVETNSMQFYPDVSLPEAAVHPGLYRRRDGVVDLSTIKGPGLGYRVEEIQRKLPEAVKL
jgi:L-alanine-DL-glutamate epimerase-like enolase superfamily enzyme